MRLALAVVALVFVAVLVGQETDCFVSQAHFEDTCCNRDDVQQQLDHLSDILSAFACCRNLYSTCPGRDPLASSVDTAFVPAVDIEFVTVTDDMEPARALFNEVPFPLRVLGSASTKYHPTYKQQMLHEFVRTLVDSGRGSTLVIMVDAFDVAWMGCETDLLGTFNRWARPLFVSAEMSIWPFNKSFSSVNRFVSNVIVDGCVTRYQKRKLKSPSNGHRSCFPNGGCWGGLATNLHEMLSELYIVGANGVYELAPKYKKILAPLVHTSIVRERRWTVLHDEQAHLYAYIYAHPLAVWIDQTAEICANLHGMRRTQFSLSGHRRLIWAHPFQRHICFAHGNGGDKNLLHNLRRSRLLDLEPTISMTSQPFFPSSEFVAEFRVPENTAYLDLGQCFKHSGMITDIIFGWGNLMPTIMISFQVYRPLVGGSLTGCKEFKILSGSEPVGVTTEERLKDRKDVFLDVMRYNMTFQPGDCLGWQVLKYSSLMRREHADYEGYCIANIETGVVAPQETLSFLQPQIDNHGHWSVWALTT